jgi:aminoglycoside 3-N-acetyltransferase
MIEKQLFKNGTEYISNTDILKILEKLGVQDCKVLYLHSQLSFGTPNPALNKKELVDTLIELLLGLNIPTLCFPTFTFSFCNGEDFNVQMSKTKMGILNEALRKHPNAVRSIDPLLSVGVIGEDIDLVQNLSKFSIGKGSNYDKIHGREGVKFLFLGPLIGDCFTYMHYLEYLLDVPYRYNRPFTGKITEDDKVYEDTYELFVRYNGITPNRGSYDYEDTLLQKGLAKRMPCGNSFITTVNEPEATEIYSNFIKKDANFFINETFSKEAVNTDFYAKNMVAL